MPRIATRRQGRVRWWLHSEQDGIPPLLDALIADPDAVLSDPRSVARESAGRKRFYRVPGDPPGSDFLVKVFTLRPGTPRLRYLLRWSKARHEATTAQRLKALGFDAAEPVATGEERSLGLLRKSYSVIPVHPARDLRVLLQDPATTRKERRALLQAFAVFARRLHDSGVDQDDFSPNNFLVTDERNFVLIDFERCRIRSSLGKRRWKLLAKLHRHDLGVSLTERLRFLHAYLGPEAGRAEHRRAWERIHHEFLQVRARDARRAARGAFKEGRHLRRDGDVWVVRGRERTPVLRLPLQPGQAREAWVLAQQLERLNLPALRPVRLLPNAIELEDPGPLLERADRAALVQAARRKFEAYGRFVTEGEWWITRDGAKLRDPCAFRLGARPDLHGIGYR